jgi:nucleoside-diphosphate-sugar epimerase
MHSVILQDCKEINSQIDFSKLKNKKILVTGASGLLGIYIVSCLKLLKETNNLEIFCWINSDLDENFIDYFSDCSIIKGDITSEIVVNTILDIHKEQKFDLIIHSAGYGQPNKFLVDKIKTIKINTISTIKLFEMLNEKGSFAFLSTSEIYSGNEKDSISEEDHGQTMPNHPRAAYIESKRCGEAICNSYSAVNKDMNIKIYRLSLAYGPGTKKDDQRVLNSLIQKGFHNDTINLMDDGSALRTYGYIADIVTMFWQLLFFGKYSTYNLCGDSKTSILELAETIGSQLKKHVVKSNNSSLIGSPKNVNLSLNRYYSEFAKKKFITLDAGIAKTIEWQRKIYGK